MKLFQIHGISTSWVKKHNYKEKKNNKEFIKYNWWWFFKIMKIYIFIAFNNCFGSFYYDYTQTSHSLITFSSLTTFPTRKIWLYIKLGNEFKPKIINLKPSLHVPSLDEYTLLIPPHEIKVTWVIIMFLKTLLANHHAIHNWSHFP